MKVTLGTRIPLFFFYIRLLGIFCCFSKVPPRPQKLYLVIRMNVSGDDATQSLCLGEQRHSLENLAKIFAYQFRSVKRNLQNTINVVDNFVSPTQICPVFEHSRFVTSAWTTSVNVKIRQIQDSEYPDHSELIAYMQRCTCIAPPFVSKVNAQVSVTLKQYVTAKKSFFQHNNMIGGRMKTVTSFNFLLL